MSTQQASLPRLSLALLALLLFSTTWWAGPLQALLDQPLLFPLPLHTVMESFAILVSILVFAISWNTHSTERPSNLIILACGFLCVGLLDFAHMLSYKGMPDFVTPASPQKGIIFWLCARYAHALTLLVVALHPWRAFRNSHSRYWLLGASLALVACIYGVVLIAPERLPRMFSEESGLTPLKIYLEYGLVALLLLVAWFFQRSAGRNPEINTNLLLSATLITILSELCFTSYTNVYDAYSLLGHAYKVLAYWFIYRAIFVSSVQQPYERLQAEIKERIRAEEAADYLFQHDSLTDLPNRHLLENRLAHSLAQAQNNRTLCAVAFVNLDNFKSINDSLGLGCGDEVLRLMAHRLAAPLRSTDTLARYGSDEFVLVLSELGSANDVMPVLQKILDTVQETSVIGGHEITLSASIGLALYPGDGKTPADLLKHSDIAMHRAKRVGGNAWRFFEEAMNATATEYLTLRNAMKKGLERGEFLLYYQPQVDLLNGRVAGAEALVRWQHPEQGLISPARFIPVAEKSGLILPLGNWILEAACRQAVSWQSAGLPPVRMAVNISAIQFQRENLAQRVAETLAVTGLAPQLLELEITESLLMQDQEHILKTIHELKQLGVRIAIDDFGTGYSSLAYLKRFSVDVLKIDQSFTRGVVESEDDLAIVNAIIQMAHSLGLNTIAEGVETAASSELLERYGCNEGQGYLFARPMPAAEFAEYLRRGHSTTA